MIQDIKDALEQYFCLQMRPSGLCPGLTYVTTSEIEPQATDNTPCLQFIFEKMAAPSSPSGSLVPGGQDWECEVTCKAILKTTGPRPEATRELHRNWATRCAPGQPLTGVGVALAGLMSGILITASGDRFMVEVGESETYEKQLAIECPITFRSQL